MNLATLEISPAEAKAHLEQYVEQLASERTVEDEAIALGYRSAARGLPVILLTQVIAAGGFFDNGLPRLAIAHADATECFVHSQWSATNVLIYSDSESSDNRGALVGAHSLRVNVDNLPTRAGKWSRAKTIVPTIPPALRPKRRRMHSRHVLWEVEAWAPVPPVDPALLRHIRGDLWAVLAIWDLTELERAVLSQRARP